MSQIPTYEQLMALPPAYLAQDQSHRLLNASIAFLVVQTFVFIAYVVSRRLHKNSNQWSTTGLVTASYLCQISLSFAGILAVTVGGMGRHLAYWLIHDPFRIRKYLQLQTAIEYLYIAVVIIPELVILSLYLKIFINPRTRLIAWGLVIALCLYFFAGCMVGFFICKPMAYKWNKLIPGGKCGDEIGVYRYISIPNIVTDVVILILPLSTLWTLQVDRARKIGIFLTFIMGGMGIIVAIVRMVGFFKVDLFPDPTYLAIPTMILTIAEPSAYFICACIPGLRPILNLFAEKTGINTLVKNTFHTMHSTNGIKPTTQNKGGRGGLSEGNGTYHTHISSTNGSDDRFGFVRLENLKTNADIHIESAIHVEREPY